jgi:hypothetical protein
LLKQALDEWGKTGPYRKMRERDPQSGDYLIVAIEEKPLPLTFNAWVGAIINSLRSALDLIASALAKRNGKRPDSNRHFPIFACELAMIDPVLGIDNKERKQWLSDKERAAIKSLKPYNGGDQSLWLLHHLDIVRKHERLLLARPTLHGMTPLRDDRVLPFTASVVETRYGKTVLGRMLAPVPITEGNTFLTLDIFVNETSLGITYEQTFPLLRCCDAIPLFDA